MPECELKYKPCSTCPLSNVVFLPAGGLKITCKIYNKSIEVHDCPYGEKP